MMYVCYQNKRNLQTATTARTLTASRVVGSGGDVFDTADLHASTGEGTEGGLGTGARGLGADTTGGAELNVEGGDTAFLAALDDVLGGEHSGVRRGLFSVLSHLHASRNSAVSFSARGVRHVDEGVVEGSVNMADSKLIVLFHFHFQFGFLVFIEGGGGRITV